MCFCTLKKALKMCFLWGQAGEGGNVGAGGAPLHRISHLDKNLVSAIMKTKGDTVTCSQASKSYYKIADHSSAIEWSACFCGEKEQQNCYQQENPQCFLPHLHHLPSHEMRWDFGGLTTEVTVSRMGHYIILRRTLSTLSKPPRRVSFEIRWRGGFFMVS